VRIFDLRVPPLEVRGADVVLGDVTDEAALRSACRGARGVFHLGGVSRVIDGERDPETCRRVNVSGMRSAIAAATDAGAWLAFSSSREVYGNSTTPGRVREGAPLAPLNVYGRSKLECEMLVRHAVRRGLRGSVVRLSNVFGSVADHVDRVVPAFARAAVEGRPMRLQGPSAAFDFTVDLDVADGLARVAELLDAGRVLPSLHLVGGKSTSLAELAQIAQDAAGSTNEIIVEPSRTYDAHRFCGDPRRALRVLGWKASTPIRVAMATLIGALRAEA
jgi:UDP-glucose 4-epimerase